ncbi:hypothetical protein [Pseudonocardia sp. GCM10023141]|uniref:hypothetical protein n=1 Tax=Pseudonocardia sp. GCM10023141 TaxID=3252653 RepID=UPI003622BFC5
MIRRTCPAPAVRMIAAMSGFPSRQGRIAGRRGITGLLCAPARRSGAGERDPGGAGRH